MASEWENEVVRFFFVSRVKRRRESVGEPMLRLQRAVARRAWAGEYDRQAARHFYERSLED